MNIILIAILIGNFNVTAYRSVPQQTDDSPFTTSIGERVSPRGIAVSRNLLKRWGGPLNYGDLVYIEEVGFKFVNDTMNERHKNRADIWVADFQQEKDFDKKFGKRKLKVWIIKENAK